ncbi:MAG: competence protein ComGC [Myxococcota bacterium]|jgi:competence protein ComGC
MSSHHRIRAFILSELVVFVCVLSVIALLAMPLALKQRSVENEQHAVAYLEMIADAQQVWHQQTGAYASLYRLATTVPISSDPNASPMSVLRVPFLALTPPMIIGDRGVAHRGGYRFQLGRTANRDIRGCWAWPNLNKYSGETSYWVDFSNFKVSQSLESYSWEETPQGSVPAAEQLINLELK